MQILLYSSERTYMERVQRDFGMGSSGSDKNLLKHKSIVCLRAATRKQSFLEYFQDALFWARAARLRPSCCDLAHRRQWGARCSCLKEFTTDMISVTCLQPAEGRKLTRASCKYDLEIILVLAKINTWDSYFTFYFKLLGNLPIKIRQLFQLMTRHIKLQ